MRSDLIDIDADLIHETEKAFLLSTDGENRIWVPKSSVENNEDGTFAMPEKLALEKGLI